jgi:nitroreductase
MLENLNGHYIESIHSFARVLRCGNKLCATAGNTVALPAPSPHPFAAASFMKLFTAIDTRASALKLAAPGPSREDIERILSAGARAPDHGKLAPWRFVVLEGNGREILANAMADALQRRSANIAPAQLEAERQKPLRAPTIIAVAAHLARGHKVPEHEQVQAVAAAVQNMFLAAHALGYGAMWKTGEAARDAGVKEALGFDSHDEIVAFLYLGTNALPGPLRPAVLTGKVRWMGEGRSES